MKAVCFWVICYTAIDNRYTLLKVLEGSLVEDGLNGTKLYETESFLKRSMGEDKIHIH